MTYNVFSGTLNPTQSINLEQICLLSGPVMASAKSQTVWNWSLNVTAGLFEDDGRFYIWNVTM